MTGNMPALLVIKCYGPHSSFAAFAEAAKGEGQLLICQPVHAVQAVEPGSLPAHVWVAQFESAQARDSAWGRLSRLLHAHGADRGKPPIVLAIAGIPAEGLGPDIPTAATVNISTSLQPPVYLLIEGSASDQQRMDKYRDIILPMMAERAAYYVAFELGGNVQVLTGDWQEAIFAISRWPSAGHAFDFWLSGRYQQDAIPLRLDIGRFDVIAMAGCS